jgi:hypothetical protein
MNFLCNATNETKPSIRTKLKGGLTIFHLFSVLLFDAVCAPSFLTAMAKEEVFPPVRLSIQSLEDGQVISKYDLGIVKFDVRFEQTIVANKPISNFDVEKLRLQMNHQTLEFLHFSPSSGIGRSVNYQTIRLAIRPGMPGLKNLTVHYGEMETECSFHYQPKGQLEVLGLIERQAILRGGTTQIRWVGVYLEPGSIGLSINGRASEAGHILGRLPELHTGMATNNSSGLPTK